MKQRLVTLRIRPPRLVVLLNASAAADEFVLVVRFLSQLLGGRYNQILPVIPNQPDDLTLFRLKQIRPDFVFGRGIESESWKPAIKTACQPRLYVDLTDTIAADIKAADVKLVHSSEAIISKFATRTVFSTSNRPLKVVSEGSSSEWSPYLAAMLGIHPENLDFKYRDERLVLDGMNVNGLVNIHRDYVDGWKHSWLDAGSYGLSLNLMASPKLAPTIVMVENVVEDLCLFWNLRLASDPHYPQWVLPIPIRDSENQDLKENLREWLQLFVGCRNFPNFCLLTSASVSRERVSEYARSLRSSLQDTGIQKVDYMRPRNRLPKVVAYEHETTRPIEVHGRQVTFLPPAPHTLCHSGNADGWFIDVVKDNLTGRAVKDMQFPGLAVVQELLNGPCPPSDVTSLVPRFGLGVDAINFRCSYGNDVVHFHMPSPKEVLEEILDEAGYRVVLDEKRSSYIPTIRQFGGLDSAATSFSRESGKAIEILRSGRAARTTHDQESEFEHQEKSAVDEKVFTLEEIKGLGKFGSGKLNDPHFFDFVKRNFETQPERRKRIGMARFRSYAHRRVSAEMTLNALLEHWVDKAVVQRRCRIGPCARCLQVSHFSNIQLNRPIKCDFCGNRVPLKSSTKIGYTLTRAVRHSLNEGIVPVVLAGRFLKRMSNQGFFWLPGVKYKKADFSGDIDFLACCDGHLVFGECKRMVSTPDGSQVWRQVLEQFLSLVSVAMDCGASLVVLAAQVHDFPANVKQTIESQVGGKIPFLLLNNLDLDQGYRDIGEGELCRYLELRDLIPTEFPESSEVK